MDVKDEAEHWLAMILGRKPSLKVGIYGSYHPESEARRLKQLRDRLKRDGYAQTYLVRDLPDLSQFKDAFDKSVFSINRSNVNLFVLTFAGKNQGDIRELDYVIHNPELAFKCVVFIERTDDATCLTSLLKEDLRAVGMRVAEFRTGDDEDLIKLVEGTLSDFLYYYVRNRPRDLGELRRRVRLQSRHQRRIRRQ
ncbi:MAG: hypothetical protein LYZ69_05490 [Nitrososphaerales archaeon]|nr:hypothetical protein [Nitrososphaerales archaeon]